MRFLFPSLILLAILASARADSYPAIEAKVIELSTRGDINATRELVDANGGPNTPLGGTALLYAIINLRLELVKNLLDGGANPERAGGGNQLPLILAIGTRDPRFVEVLLQHGAKPNRLGRCLSQTCQGHPSLFYAASCAEPGIVKLLLDAGADVTWNNHAAAYVANRNHDTETFRLLRAAGSHVEMSSMEAAMPQSARSVSALGLSELLPSAVSPAPPHLIGEKCRIAIIASEELSAFADVLAVRLAKESSLVVVERAELDRVIEEQKLARGMGMNSALTMKIGALVSADALIVLENHTFGSLGITQSRFVQVHPGLVLDTANVPAPIRDPEVWADSVGSRVIALAGKALAPKAVALSMTPFRNSLGTIAERNLGDSIAFLLTDRLVRQPSVHILERQAVDDLMREHSFGKAGYFWTASWLLDGTVEVSPDNSGAVALSLRLQNGKGGDPVSIFVRGNTQQLSKLLDETANQITRVLMQKEVGFQKDPTMEMSHYLNEARNGLKCRAFLTAQRGAETAWLLGSQDVDTAYLRVLTGVRALQWQYARMIAEDPQERDPVRGKIWDKNWMDERLGTKGWLTQRGILEESTLNVGYWREGLSRLSNSGPDKKQEYLKLVDDLIETVALTFTIFDTAIGELDYSDKLGALADEVKWMLQDAESLSERDPSLFWVQNDVSIGRILLGRCLYPNSSALAAMVTTELEKHFAERDTMTRARLRRMVSHFDGSHQVRLYGFESNQSGPSFQFRMPSCRQILGPLVKFLEASADPEDRFLGECLLFDAESDPAKKREHGKRMFDWIWEMRDFFASDPTVEEQYSELFRGFGRARDPAAREFNWSPVPGQKGQTRPSNEMHALFVKMALYILEHAPADAKIYTNIFYDSFRTPEESAALDSAWKARRDKLADGKGNNLTQVKSYTPPERDGLPPLRIKRYWSPESLLPADVNFAKLDFETLTFDGNLAWICGKALTGARGETVDEFLFRIEIPSLNTQVIPLPSSEDATPLLLGRPTYITITADYIFCGRYGSQLLTYDRKGQKWWVNNEIKPSGALLWGESIGFQSTRASDVDAIVKIDPKRQSAEVLASTQRSPAISPLDEPNLEFQKLRMARPNELVVEATDKRASYGRGEEVRPKSDSKVRSFTYYIDELRWADNGEVDTSDFRKAILMQWEHSYLSNVWPGSRMALIQMPETRRSAAVPLEFIEQNGDIKTVDQLVGLRCRSDKTGHFFSAFQCYGFWFLSQSELDGYLQDRNKLPKR